MHASYRQVHERRLDQWLIGSCWVSFLEVTGDPQDPGQVAKGSDLVLAVLGPYLTGHDTEREQS